MEQLRKIIRLVLKEEFGTEETPAEFENVPLGRIVTFSDIEGWGAEGNRWNEINIYSDEKKLVGKLEYDEYSKLTRIFYGEDEHGNWKHIDSWPVFGNVKNAVRFVFLQSQKSKIVDEIVSTGEGDLENYFKENPAALNNDYVDNYLDQQDYYISDKIPSRIPSLWN